MGTVSAQRLLVGFFACICLLTACGSGRAKNSNDETGGSPSVGPQGPSLILTIASSFTTDNCEMASVDLVDGSGNLLPVSVSTPISLVGAGANGSFYSAATCTGPITSITLPVGSSSAIVWYRKTSIGTVTLRASAAGVKSTSLAVNVGVGATYKLAFTTAPTAISAGAASKACYNYRITAQDQMGGTAPITGSALTVNFNDGGAGGTFYSNSTCTNAVIPALAIGASVLNVYYNIPSSSPGNVVSLTATSSLPLSSTSRSVTVSSGLPKKLALSGAAVGIVNGCYPYTIKAVDENNALETSGFPAIAIQLSRSGNGGFYSTSACTGGAITSTNIAAGASSVVVYYKKPSSGLDTLSATDVAGVLTASSVSTNISSGTAQALAFSAGASSQNVGACGNFTLQARDENNQVSVIAGVPEVINLLDGADGNFYLGSGCTGGRITSAQINLGASSVAISYLKPTVGSVTLSASGTGMFSASKTFSLFVGTPASKLAFIGSATPLVGTCEVYRIQSQNSSSTPTNVTATTTVVLASEMTQGGFYSDSSCNVQISAINLNAGTNTATFYLYNSISEPVTLTGTASGLTQASLPVSF